MGGEEEDTCVIISHSAEAFHIHFTCDGFLEIQQLKTDYKAQITMSVCVLPAYPERARPGVGVMVGVNE